MHIYQNNCIYESIHQLIQFSLINPSVRRGITDLARLWEWKILQNSLLHILEHTYCWSILRRTDKYRLSSHNFRVSMEYTGDRDTVVVVFVYCSST